VSAVEGWPVVSPPAARTSVHMRLPQASSQGARRVHCSPIGASFMTGAARAGNGPAPVAQGLS